MTENQRENIKKKKKNAAFHTDDQFELYYVYQNI